MNNNQAQQNELLHRTLAQDHHNNFPVHQSVQANSSSQIFNVQSPIQNPVPKQNNSIHNQSVAQSLGYGAVSKQDLLNASSSQVRNASYRNEPQEVAAANNFELWCSPSPQKAPNFCIYEQSMQEIQSQIPPKGEIRSKLCRNSDVIFQVAP